MGKNLMFKKKLQLVVVLCLFLTTTLVVEAQGPTPTGAKPPTVEYIVTADSANLRSAPSTTATRVGTVSKGDVVLVYAEGATTSGWLKIYREGMDDAYIADFLVERAPTRFYPIDQKPLIEVSGRGKAISDVFDIPRGAYRIDVTVSDNAFILKSITVEGECEDEIIFNEFNVAVKSMVLSGLFVSTGCSVIFETDNVDNNWQFEIRDIIVDADFLADNTLIVFDGTTITGKGRSLTMSTLLLEGIWTIKATVEDNAFILQPQVLTGDCSTYAAFNELDLQATKLEISTIYRVPKDGCYIFWETSNVDSSWVLQFSKVR